MVCIPLGNASTFESLEGVVGVVKAVWLMSIRPRFPHEKLSLTATAVTVRHADGVVAKGLHAVDLVDRRVAATEQAAGLLAERLAAGVHLQLGGDPVRGSGDVDAAVLTGQFTAPDAGSP